MRKQIVFFILSCLIVSSLATELINGGQKQGGYYDNSDRNNVFSGTKKIGLYQRYEGSPTNGAQDSSKFYREQLNSGKSEQKSSRFSDEYGRVNIKSSNSRNLSFEQKPENKRRSNLNIQTQKQPTQQVIAGGYRLINDISSNTEALEAINFARSTLPLIQNSIMIQASRQVVNGINYQLLFKFQYLPNIFLNYLVKVYKPIRGNYQITLSQYYKTSIPQPAAFVKGNIRNQYKYLKNINDQVSFQLKQKLSGSDIAGLEFYFPYYIISYRIDQSTVLRVTLIFDPVVNATTILSTSKSILSISTSNSNSRNEESGTRQFIKTTTARAQNLIIPLKFPISFFNKFDLPVSSILYSNIIPYDQQTFASYNKISQAQSAIRQLAQAIVDNIDQQLKRLGSDSYVTQCKFKREQGKINFGIIIVMRGQKGLQNIMVLLPESIVTQKILYPKQIRNEIPEIRTSFKNKVLNSANPDLIARRIYNSDPKQKRQVLNLRKQVNNKIKQNKSLTSHIGAVNIIKNVESQIPKQAKKALVSKTQTSEVTKQPVKTDSTKSKSQLLINQQLIQKQRFIVETIKPSDSETQIKVESKPNIVSQVVSNSAQKSGSFKAKVNIQSKPQIQSANIPNKTSQTSAAQPHKLIVHNTQSSSVSQKSPNFAVSPKANNLLSSASGISDPALIPFLTSSYTQVDFKKIENIAKFIIKKAKITSDFTIVLINQIKYGIRLVIQLKNVHNLFQALVTSDNKQPQLLFWRRISKISDINPDCFSQYHRIIPDQDLKTLIVKIFSKTEAIRKLKQIIYAQKKITFDGIYYRFIVESNSGNIFLVVFYYIPEKNYDQIVRYELINNDFDSKRQVQFDVLPVGNKQYEASKKYLFDHYSVILKDTFISYLSSSEGKLGKYFRFVFSGLKGKYEAILMNNHKDNTVTIVRWEKLQDGYISIQIDKLLKDDQFKSIRNSVKEYIQSKFSFQAEPSYLSIKQIPAKSSFYKLLYLKPFPFVLSVEQRSADHNLFIRGLQRVQIAPINQYYNDRFFAGYSMLNIGQLPYDQDYLQFESRMQKQAKLKSGDYQVKSAFRMKTPTGLFYKIVYLVWDKEYLASYNYDFVEKIYKLLEFKLYFRQIEEGDYRWKCLSVNGRLSVCEKCDESTILTSGRCYKKQPACQLQIASSCYTCLPGFIRSSHICRKSPAETLPKIAPVVASDQPIVTASGTSIITYANGNDQNCLQSQGSICLKCIYRFYVRNGVCKKVQDQCDVFSNQGQCYNCYTGHYLRKGSCIKLQPTCAQANQDGYCKKCYKNYINIQGNCYIRSNLKLSQNSVPPADQLCIRWKDNKCLQCQFGCFWSTKLNKCAIKDAFCQDWNNQKEECEICQRDYGKYGGKCLRNN